MNLIAVYIGVVVVIVELAISLTRWRLGWRAQPLPGHNTCYALGGRAPFCPSLVVSPWGEVLRAYQEPEADA
jgi:hypothetical protein